MKRSEVIAKYQKHQNKLLKIIPATASGKNSHEELIKVQCELEIGKQVISALKVLTSLE